MIDKNELIDLAKQKIDRDRIVNFTIDLCKQDTTNPPGNESLCVPVIKRFFSENLNTKIEVFEKEKGRSNLIVTFEGNKPGPTVAVVMHTDVVSAKGQFWDSDPFDPVIKDGLIVARGSADNKGPSASVSEAVKVFSEITKNQFPGKIILIYAADEECGSEAGIKYLLNDVDISCDYALIPDNGEKSQLVYGEMGIYLIEVSMFGKAFHGSRPEMGLNAVIPMSDLVVRLGNFDWTKLKGDPHFDNVVLNIGLISGGSATNTVPHEARATFMWRFPIGVENSMINDIVEKEIEDIKNKYKGIKHELKILHSSEPYIGNSEGRLIQKAIDSREDLKMEKIILKTIRAETVAKFIHKKLTNAEIIVNGPEDGSSEKMHIQNENISIDSLVDFSLYYVVLLYNLLCTE